MTKVRKSEDAVVFQLVYCLANVSIWVFSFGFIHWYSSPRELKPDQGMSGKGQGISYLRMSLNPILANIFLSLSNLV